MHIGFLLVMKKILITLIPVLIFFTSLQKIQAQHQQLQTVFINSFIKYVNWPDKYNVDDFKIAVINNSPIVPHLKKLAEVKKVDGRNIVVETYESLDQIKGVHILYLPANQSAALEEALRRFRKSSTMIITEKEGLCAKGSHINFVSRNDRLAFEINMEAMEKSKLKVATELARLAIEI